MIFWLPWSSCIGFFINTFSNRPCFSNNISPLMQASKAWCLKWVLSKLESFDWGMHPFEAQSVSTSTDYEYRTQRTTPHVCGARSPAEVPLAFTGGSRNAMNHFRQRLRRLLPSAHCRARLDHAWSRNVQVKQPAELPPEIWSTWNSCNTVNVSPSVRAIPHTQTQACATLWNCDLLCLSLFATSMSSITHRFISSRMPHFTSFSMR